MDRVEFVKKQVMLYVFLKKEVNEICEKVGDYSVHFFFAFSHFQINLLNNVFNTYALKLFSQKNVLSP